MVKVKCPETGEIIEYDESEIHSHFLMCGDSTSIDDVEKLMNGVKADMVFTDPHYIDVIIQRWEQFSEKKAVLLNGGEAK